MRRKRLQFNLPEISADWAEFDDGTVLGGLIFICRPGGCKKFTRICGKSPKAGGPLQYCDFREGRIEALRRFKERAREWYEEE